MTAYLQPGDRIHLAVPITRGQTPDDARAEGLSGVQELATVYGEFGVQIATWSAHTELDWPMVVAVFRGLPQPGEASHG